MTAGWPHLQLEVAEEAELGSNTYPPSMRHPCSTEKLAVADFVVVVVIAVTVHPVAR